MNVRGVSQLPHNYVGSYSAKVLVDHPQNVDE